MSENNTSTASYVVDITKPPIFPPNRWFKSHWLAGDIETKESLAQTAAWDAYIKEYGRQLDTAK